MVKNGYEVMLVVADGKGNEIKDGVTIYDIGKPSGRLNRITKSSKKIFKKALDLNADIYHFHDPELIFTGKKLIKKGKKVIYDIHEDLPRQILTKPYLHKYLTKIISNLAEKLENYAAKKFSYLITATGHIENRFLKINKNVVSVLNYPFLSEFTDLSTNWTEKENTICYIGGISKVRGVYEAVDALSLVNTSMLLAGSFQPPEFKETLVKSAGWGKVDFLGFLDRKEITNVLSRSKIGLVTLYPTINYLDSLPVKMFEYMAAGIPVIASNFELWKSIIEDADCGICVDPLNIKDIAFAIEELLGDDNRAKEMGQNGKNAVHNKYNWETEELKLLKVYSEIIK